MNGTIELPHDLNMVCTESYVLCITNKMLKYAHIQYHSQLHMMLTLHAFLPHLRQLLQFFKKLIESAGAAGNM